MDNRKGSDSLLNPLRQHLLNLRILGVDIRQRNDIIAHPTLRQREMKRGGTNNVLVRLV